MTMDRRTLLKTGLLGSALAAGGGFAASLLGRVTHGATGLIGQTIKPVENPGPITQQEREARIRKAQALMAQYDIDAILVEAGTALNYLSGVRWGRSERLTGLVIPKNGMIGTALSPPQILVN